MRIFELNRLPITSNASRSSYRYNALWSLSDKVKKLSIRKRWNAGRNDSGRIVSWTRKSLLIKYKSIRINYNLRYNHLGFIASFQLIPFRNKLMTLMYFANGAISYYLCSDSHKIFSYSMLNRHKRVRKFSFKSIFLMLFQIKKLTLVSTLELLPGRGAQYARSNGTSCKLIRFDEPTHTVLVRLPSSVKKLFSYHSFASLGRVSLATNRKYTNTRSGYWRSFGVKSIVRGVAMNPVDHPHGGRTNTIKCPRTPWGKPTKLK